MDIIDIDNKIKTKFKEEQTELDDLIKKYDDLNMLSENVTNKDDINKMMLSLSERIRDIKSQRTYNFYIIDTADIINKYKQILSTPVRISFTAPKKIVNPELQQLQNLFVEIAKKYNIIDIPQPTIDLTSKFEIQCFNCSNNKSFYIIDIIYYICTECNYQQEINTNMLSYNDYNRINVTTKYIYDRRIHFKECINQYQGIQNSNISEKVYEDLEKECAKNNLLIDSPNKFIRFSRITKEHILTFLKELEYPKQYENIILIYYNLTGKKPDNISHLVDKLIDDFSIFIDTYDKYIKNKIDRKSFINIQYVFYQLLLKHKHPCNKDDFNVLKTAERQKFHDYVTSEVFYHLGWTFTPIY